MLRCQLMDPADLVLQFKDWPAALVAQMGMWQRCPPNGALDHRFCSFVSHSLRAMRGIAATQLPRVSGGQRLVELARCSEVARSLRLVVALTRAATHLLGEGAVGGDAMAHLAAVLTAIHSATIHSNRYDTHFIRNENGAEEHARVSEDASGLRVESIEAVVELLHAQRRIAGTQEILLPGLQLLRSLYESNQSQIDLVLECEDRWRLRDAVCDICDGMLEVDDAEVKQEVAALRQHCQAWGSPAEMKPGFASPEPPTLINLSLSPSP